MGEICYYRRTAALARWRQGRRPSNISVRRIPIELDAGVRDISGATLSGRFGECQKQPNAVLYVVNGQPAVIAAKDAPDEVQHGLAGFVSGLRVTHHRRGDGLKNFLRACAAVASIPVDTSPDKLASPVMPSGTGGLTPRI